VRNLQLFVSALSSSSDLLASFNTNLGRHHHGVCPTRPTKWPTRPRAWTAAVNDLRSFVAENREGLGVTFDASTRSPRRSTTGAGRQAGTAHRADGVPELHEHLPAAQSAVTGILAPVNFANTVQFICSAIQAASRENWEAILEAVRPYLAPIIKNRQYNFPPLGFKPVRRRVGAAQ